MFHEAILKTGAPMLLSLSPGSAPDERGRQPHAVRPAVAHLGRCLGHLAVQRPHSPRASTTRSPAPLNGSLTPAPATGLTPTCFPIGKLSPSPGWGKPRASRLTPDEQRSMINLWSIVRSPLVYGGDPVTTDAATLALLTNPAVIAIDQHSRNTRNPVLTKDLAVYTAEPASGPGLYVAVFNRQDTPQDITLPWAAVGLHNGTHASSDLWTKFNTAAPNLKLTLAPHASTILEVR